MVFGVALGTATLGSLVTAVYRARIADSVPPDVPAGAARAAHEGIAAVLAAGRSCDVEPPNVTNLMANGVAAHERRTT